MRLNQSAGIFGLSPVFKILYYVLWRENIRENLVLSSKELIFILKQEIAHITENMNNII